MTTTYRVMLKVGARAYLELDRYTRETHGDDYRGAALDHAQEAITRGRAVEVGQRLARPHVLQRDGGPLMTVRARV